MNSTKSLGVVSTVMFGCAKKANNQNHCLQIGKSKSTRKPLSTQNVLSKVNVPFFNIPVDFNSAW